MKKILILAPIFLLQVFCCAGKSPLYDLSPYTYAVLKIGNVAVTHSKSPWGAKLYTNPGEVKHLKEVFQDFESHHLCAIGWTLTFFNAKGETQSFRISEDCEEYLKKDSRFWMDFKRDIDSARISPTQTVCQLMIPATVSPQAFLKALHKNPSMHALFYDSEMNRLPSATVQLTFVLKTENKAGADTAKQQLERCIHHLPKKFKVVGSRVMMRSSSPTENNFFYVYEGTIFFEFGQDLEGITAGTAPVELLHCALPTNYTITVICDNKPAKELEASLRKLVPELISFRRDLN